jgi:hypothetical protein
MMYSTKAEERSQDSKRQHAPLDRRYGKIGISAVAAAIRYNGESREEPDVRLVPYERD